MSFAGRHRSHVYHDETEVAAACIHHGVWDMLSSPQDLASASQPDPRDVYHMYGLPRSHIYVF